MQDPVYKRIFAKSVFGLIVWILIAVWAVVQMYRGGAEQFSFLSAKMRPKYYW